LLQQAVNADTSDFNNPMWAVLVNRSAVCMVAFLNRMIVNFLSADKLPQPKAFTANGLAIVQDGEIEALDTKDLDLLVPAQAPSMAWHSATRLIQQ
jgi:hypothetical protein